MFSPRLQTTIILALLFLVVSSPMMYTWVNGLIAKPVLRMPVVENNVPTRFGQVLHAIVFALLVHFFVLK